jgi:hypothetical protein
MPSRIVQLDSYPTGERAYGQDPITRLICGKRPRPETGPYVRISDVPSSGFDGTPLEVARRFGYTPLIGTLDTDRHANLYQQSILEAYDVFRYWITVPQVRLSPVRAFVRAAFGDELPETWTETNAIDEDERAYAIVSFTATIPEARSFGAQQQAIEGLASIPGDTSFFQAIIDSYEGPFSGLTKASRQPTKKEPTTYPPGSLFQTDIEELSSNRGQQFSQLDVISAAGLSIP